MTEAFAKQEAQRRADIFDRMYTVYASHLRPGEYLVFPGAPMDMRWYTPLASFAPMSWRSPNREATECKPPQN